MIQPSAVHATASRAFLAVQADALRFARFNVPLLFEGEPGTGKNTLAREVHDCSSRPGRFMWESIPWIPKDLEAARFAGHVRGSFTGAVNDSVGIIAQAHKGTLFLDELAEASPQVQAILLKVLESQTVTPMGGREERHVDVRIVAATNANLDQLVREGRFRRDLLDRFGYFRFRLPSLAERREEIPHLTQHLLQAATAKFGLEAKFEISPAVAALLSKAPWPDNIRGLENVCDWAAVFAYSDGEHVIELRHLPPRFLDSLGIRVRPAEHARGRARRVFEEAGGNISEVARRLGVSRPTVYEWLRDSDALPVPAAAVEEAL